MKAKTGSDVLAGGHQLAGGGLWVLKLALDAAKTDDLEKFRAAVMTLDLPVGSPINGWGVKFDETGQNSNARVQHYMLQWQNGSLVTVWPEEFTTNRAKWIRSAPGTSGSRQRAPPGAPSAPGPPDMRAPPAVVSTILLGGIYALIAVGLTLIFGVMRVVNFAHGEFLMLGMYLAFWAFTLLHFDPYLTLVVSLPLFFAVGWAATRSSCARSSTPRTTCRCSRRSGCPSCCRTWRSCSGPPTRASCAPSYYAVVMRIGGAAFNLAQSGGVRHGGRRSPPRSSPSCAGRTRARSCARPRRTAHAAALMGIDTDRVYALTWAVGIACVGAAGVLLAPIYPVYPTAGLQFVLIAYIAVVLGGLGDMVGALIAALIVAAVEVVGSYIIGTRGRRCSTSSSSSPSSSCGRPGSSGSAAPRRSGREAPAPGDRRSSPPPASRRSSCATRSSSTGWCLILIWGCAAAAWNVAGGYAGQISLGHSAFFGLGAYAAALCVDALEHLAVARPRDRRGAGDGGRHRHRLPRRTACAARTS